MKKLYVICYIMVLIVLSSFASATLPIPVIYYNAEESLDNAIASGYNLTVTDGTSGGGIFGYSNDSKVGDYSFNFTSTGINSGAFLMNDTMGTFATGVRTIDFWFKTQPVITWDQGLISFGDLSGTLGVYFSVESDDSTIFSYSPDQGSYEYGNTSITLDEWHQMIIIVDGAANLDVYLDGQTWINFSRPSFDYKVTYTAFMIGGHSAKQGMSTGLFDNVAIFDEEYTSQDIMDSWNGGAGFDFLNIIATAATPIIESPSPADTQADNVNVTLNVSHPTANNDVNYTLYFGTSSTLTEADIILNNVSRNGSEYSTWTTNVAVDGTYYWKYKAHNNTNGVFSANTTQRSWTLDTTNPTITLQANNTFNSSDVSATNQYLDFFVIGIRIDDETELSGFLINITKDGTLIYNFTNETLAGHTTYNFSRNLSTSLWKTGVYSIEVSASDAHTLNSISDYDVKDGINTIEFNTAEGNEIKISSDGSSYRTLHEKQKDRYFFGFDYLFSDNTRKFTLEADSPISYHPNSKYIGHFTVGGVRGNWIDFEGIGKDYSVKRVNDYKYEITFINLPNHNQIISKSLGGVNVITENYEWYKGNYSVTAPDVTTFENTEIFTLNISRNSSFVTPSAFFWYGGINYATSQTSTSDYIAFTRTLDIPQPSTVSENITFFWDVNITQSDGGVYSFNISGSLNSSEGLLDNCSNFNSTILRIFGKDEETDLDVDTTLNILLIPSSGLEQSYELSGTTNYSFCTNSDINFTLDSIMEYGDGVTYTNRKYYLNNLSINISTISEVTLYHLNNSKASEIVFTVFDTQSGDKVPGAFIKILRFYPGENVFRIVEISKTDEVGESLGKMVLADVFYKFIIEAPAGRIKLDTGTLRVLSLTRSFGIAFTTDFLDTWTRINNVDASVTCTKRTQTCRVTWSDSSNVVQDVTLEVWRMTGLADRLLFKQTTAGAAGTISYTVTEDTTGNRYVAKGFLESNTGTSTYPISWDEFFFSNNPFFTNETHRIASLFPLFLLGVVILFVFLDFGVVGISISALLIM